MMKQYHCSIKAWGLSKSPQRQSSLGSSLTTESFLLAFQIFYTYVFILWKGWINVEVRGQLTVLLIPTCGFWQLNSCRQIGLQKLLHVEIFHQLYCRNSGFSKHFSFSVSYDIVSDHMLLFNTDSFISTCEFLSLNHNKISFQARVTRSNTEHEVKFAFEISDNVF